jgi:hypothetical protein
MEFHPMTMPELRRWFQFLSARLRHVRILNGDWSRLCTPGALQTLKVRMGDATGDDVAGVFLDPPYGAEAGRAALYGLEEDFAVATAVRAWCLANGANPRYRIVLAGFEGEGHEALEEAGWRCVPWFQAGYLRGGMAQQGAGHQQHRERLWLSPFCLPTSAEAQPERPPLFALWDDGD